LGAHFAKDHNLPIDLSWMNRNNVMYRKLPQGTPFLTYSGPSKLRDFTVEPSKLDMRKISSLPPTGRIFTARKLQAFIFSAEKNERCSRSGPEKGGRTTAVTECGTRFGQATAHAKKKRIITLVN
jgi:hypothetical protein